MEDMIIAYCDGSANNRTHNKGGWGAVIIENGVESEHHSQATYYNTTSARMEIRAVIETLKLIQNKSDDIQIYCDNQYVVNAVQKGWLFKWEEQSFIGRKNEDLWKLFLQEYRKLTGSFSLIWVRGHNGNEHNELADHLATIGANLETYINDKVKS